jgi:hypothetical protein
MVVKEGYPFYLLTCNHECGFGPEEARPPWHSGGHEVEGAAEDHSPQLLVLQCRVAGGLAMS